MDVKKVREVLVKFNDGGTLGHTAYNLLAEVERLQKLSLTCCSCHKALSSLEELKAHIVACPDHPIAQYVKQERESIAQYLEEMAVECDKFAGIDCLTPEAVEKYRRHANMLRMHGERIKTGQYKAFMKR